MDVLRPVVLLRICAASLIKKMHRSLAAFSIMLRACHVSISIS